MSKKQEYELGSMCCSADFEIKEKQTICKKCKNICYIWMILKIDKNNWKKYV